MKIKATSKAAHDSIKSAKGYYHQKVLEGLTKLRVGGTFAEIALAVGLAPDKIWKRMSELQKEQKIYDTGITRALPSGRKGTVWQIYGLNYADPENPKTDTEVKALKKAGIPIKENKTFTQPQLF